MAPTRSIDAQGQIVALPLLLLVSIIVAGNPDAVAARLSAEWYVSTFSVSLILLPVSVAAAQR